MLAVTCPPEDGAVRIPLTLRAGEVTDLVYANVIVNFPEPTLRVCYLFDHTTEYVTVPSTLTIALLQGIYPHDVVVDRNNTLTLSGLALRTGDELKLVESGRTCADEGLEAVVDDSRAVFLFTEVNVLYHACYRYHMISEQWIEYPAIEVMTTNLVISAVVPSYADVMHEARMTLVGTGLVTGCVKFVPFGMSCDAEGEGNVDVDDENSFLVTFMTTGRKAVCFSFECGTMYEPDGSGRGRGGSDVGGAAADGLVQADDPDAGGLRHPGG